MNHRRRTISRRRTRQDRRQSLFQGGMTSRALHAEQLEPRMLLAGDVNFHNTFYPQDVDLNLRVTPRDALVIINALNAGGPREFAAASGEVQAASTVEGESSSSTFMYDVNNDGRLSASDALRVVNYLNAQEGEHAEVMEFRIVLLQPGTTNPLPSTITKGTDFEIGVIVQDIRGADQLGTEGDRGVFSAMLDVNLLSKALAKVEIEEIQRIKITGNPTGGSFTLSFNDGTTTTTTTAIQYLPLTESRVAIANRIQTALASRSNIGAGNVEVIPSLSDPQAFDVRFQGALGDKSFVLMTGNPANLTGGTNPAIQITEVVDGTYSAEAFRQALRRYQVVAGQLIADYNQVVTGSDAVSPDRIDDVGGVHTDFLTGHFPDGTEADPRLLFRVRMNSLDAGTFSVAGSVANISGENLLYSVLDPSHGDPLLPTEVKITNPSALKIIEPFSANADSFTFNEDPGTQSLNVTSNDTTNNAQGNPNGALPANVVIVSTSAASLGGTVAINPGGKTLNYTPALNANGTETFTYTLRNPTTGVTDTATVTITLNAVNDAPVNVLPGPRTVAEDGTLTFAGNLSIGDIDAGAANVQTTLSVSNGTLTLSTTAGLTFIAGANNSASMMIQGSLVSINAALNGMQYHPNANFNGSESLQINTSDLGNSGTGGSLSDNDSLQITVTAVNDAPVVTVPGPQSPVETVPTAFPAITVSDVDFGPTSPSNMRVTISVDGSGSFTLASTTGLSFTAGDGTSDSTMTFTGNLTNINAALNGIIYTAGLGDAAAQRTLTINANDNGSVGTGALSDEKTVAINVIPLDRPFAFDDLATVNEDSAANAIDVLDNDFTDDPLTHTAFLVDFTQPAHGTVTQQGELLLYTPDPDFFGTDTFTYRMNQTPDGKLPGELDEDQTGLVTITVTNTPDAPVASGDTGSTNEDVAVDIAVLANDLDVDLGVPPASQTPTSATHKVIIVSQPANGTASVNANGTIKYTPNANFNGADSFTYKINDKTDGTGLDSNVVSVDVTINAVNDAPVAVNNSYSVAEDNTLTVSDPALGVVANDTDVENSVLTVVPGSVTQPANGSVSVGADGTFTYTPNANFFGTDTFKYRVTDGDLTSAEGTVTITVTAVNDAPVAADDTYTATEDTPRIVSTFAQGLIGNDTDVDNTQAQLSIVAGSVTDPANGSVVVNSNGTFTYTPDANFTGSDTFTYRVKDPGNAESNTATVTIIVQEVNDPPVAVGDGYSVDEDNTLNAVASVLANDTDPDTAPGLLKAVNASDPAHGTVTLNQNGTFTYTPDANYFGPDSFTYQVDDGQNLSNTATVSITVNSVNDNPVVADDVFTAIKHNPPVQNFPDQQINVLANDRVNDPDPGETLTIIAVSDPANGTAVIAADGKSVLYTPDVGYEGADSFTYTVQDNGTNPSNLQSTATVNINVVNFIPTDISGTVWTDTDNDGVIDPVERKLAGVEIHLQGTSFRGAAVNQTVTSDVNGFYIFVDVEPGDYTVTESQPSYLRDGKDDYNTQTNGFDTAIPIVTGEFNDRFTLSIPLLSTDDPSKALAGNNFGEMGFDTAYINIAELLASTTNNGLILAIGAGGQQLWQTRLDGWSGMLSCSAVLNSNNSLTLTVIDGSGSHVSTISQSGTPRFRIIGQDGAGGYLIRIEGTAADFGWSLASAQSQPPEGEADYTRSVDSVMNEIGSA